MTEDTGQQHDARRLPGAGREKIAEQGSNFLGRLLGSLMTKVIVLVVIVLVGAYVLIAKLENLNPFASHTTITTTVVGRGARFRVAAGGRRAAPDAGRGQLVRRRGPDPVTTGLGGVRGGRRHPGSRPRRRHPATGTPWP
jgi:hypothetical protein